MAIKRCITVSFKNTKKDIALYELLMSMEDRSTEIKQVLHPYYSKDIKVDTSKPENKKIEKEEVNILDF